MALEMGKMEKTGMAGTFPDESRRAEIAERLKGVENRIREACRKAGRPAEEVTLLAVSKKKPMQDILAACAAGQRAFGENYVQELRDKQEMLETLAPMEDQQRPSGRPEGLDLIQNGGGANQNGQGESQDSGSVPVPISWHMIGHLQRNKVKYLIGKVSLIHSVDSVELAEQIEKEAAKKDVGMDILLEANVAEEDSKWGFSADALLAAAQEISAFPHVRIRGLMTSAPYTEDPDSNRPYFRKLKALYEALKEADLPHAQVDTLSMGMSGDYEVAIEEGATLVRIGTSIFGERVS